MALRLSLCTFEAPPFVFNPMSCRTSSPVSRSSLHTSSVKAPSLHVRRRKLSIIIATIGNKETELRVPAVEDDVLVREENEDPSTSSQLEKEASPEDLEYIRQIKRVLELLKKNRDMLFDEVKLTIMIEDPRDVERKRLLGIEGADDVTRDDLAAALEDVHEGRIPKDRAALRLLTEEIINWPDLEVEVPKSKRAKSLYAKATNTGIDPREAAKRLNIDWDSAADIESEDEDGDLEVPSAVGFGALYLVTALPLLIGASVILVLFYNSLQ